MSTKPTCWLNESNWYNTVIMQYKISQQCFSSTVCLKYQQESFEHIEMGENRSNSLFWLVEVFVWEDWFTGIPLLDTLLTIFIKWAGWKLFS